jgi:hypothetical protein
VFDWYDVMAGVGLVVLCVGIGLMASVALGLTVGGGVLVVVGLMGAWRKGGQA